MTPAVAARSCRQRSAWRARLAVLAVLAVLGLSVALAGWQWRRALDKDAAFIRQQAQRVLPPLSLPAGGVPAALVFRRVTLHGVALDDATVWLDNSINGGESGYRVLTPVRLDDGHAVLVERGWLARRDAAAPLPALGRNGPVTLGGVALPLPGRRLTLSDDTRAGKVWQTLDLPALERAYGLDLLPLLVAVDPVASPLRPLAVESDSGAGRHRAYALQWLLLGLAAGGVYRAAAARRSRP